MIFWWNENEIRLNSFHAGITKHDWSNTWIYNASFSYPLTEWEDSWEKLYCVYTNFIPFAWKKHNISTVAYGFAWNLCNEETTGFRMIYFCTPMFSVKSVLVCNITHGSIHSTFFIFFILHPSLYWCFGITKSWLRNFQSFPNFRGSHFHRTGKSVQSSS